MQELSGWDAESDSRDTDSLPSPQGARNVDEADKPTTFPDPRTEVLQLEAQYATIVSQLERRNRDYDSLDTEHQSLSDSLTRLQETNVSQFFKIRCKFVNLVGCTHDADC